MIIDSAQKKFLLWIWIYWTYACWPYIQKPEVSEGSRRGEDTGAKGFGEICLQKPYSMYRLNRGVK